MEPPTYYRERAEDLRYRACLTSDPELREQLKIAARDYEELGRQAEEEASERR